MKILSLHGRNEFCHNYNYEMLTSNCPEYEIITVDVDMARIKPEAMIFDCMLQNYDLVIGNCLGGFYAYIVGGLQHVATLLINPMIPPEQYIQDNLPDYKFKNQIGPVWNKYRGTNKDIHLFAGDNDLTVNNNDVARIIKCKTLNHFEDGHTPISEMYEYMLCSKVHELLKED